MFIEDTLTCELLDEFTRCVGWEHSLMEEIIDDDQAYDRTDNHTHHVYYRGDEHGDGSHIYHVIWRKDSPEQAMDEWRRNKRNISSRRAQDAYGGMLPPGAPDFLMEVRGVKEIEDLRKQLVARTHIDIYEGPTDEFRNLIRMSNSKELYDIHKNMFIANIIWVHGCEIHKVFVSRNFINNVDDFKWSHRKVALRIVNAIFQ